MAVSVALALVLTASQCTIGGSDPRTVADLNADTIDELALRDALLSRHSPADFADETRLTAANVALYRTMATMYFSPELQRSVVLQSLDDWESTAGSLRTRLTQPDDTVKDTAERDRVIDEFRETLEQAIVSGASLDVDDFLSLPAVDRMIVELRDSFAAGGLDELS